MCTRMLGHIKVVHRHTTSYHIVLGRQIFIAVLSDEQVKNLALFLDNLPTQGLARSRIHNKFFQDCLLFFGQKVYVFCCLIQKFTNTIMLFDEGNTFIFIYSIVIFHILLYLVSLTLQIFNQWHGKKLCYILYRKDNSLVSFLKKLNVAEHISIHYLQFVQIRKRVLAQNKSYMYLHVNFLT